MDVYILDVTAFLPNEPVNNDEMEKVLGMVGNIPSRVKHVILRRNGILQRYYALDPITGDFTHNNAELAAEAVRLLQPYHGFSLKDIECLACGTATPDHVFPGHAAMVHGELEVGPCEIISTQGACVTGMTALKYAFMNVALGLSGNAVAAGSEICSSFVRGKFYDHPDDPITPEARGESILPFDADFIRWMLSDGAGAAFLSAKPSPDAISLRIDWIDVVSYAHEIETCMYAGAEKLEDGRLKGWREFDPMEARTNNALAIKQDVKILNGQGGTFCVDKALSRVLARHPISPSEVTWFLPHISSEFFRPVLRDHMIDIGFEIPQERWFTNLATKGNTGAASIYIMLEDLWHTGRIERGDRLLLFVPESARFTISYALLTAV